MQNSDFSSRIRTLKSTRSILVGVYSPTKKTKRIYLRTIVTMDYFSSFALDDSEEASVVVPEESDILCGRGKWLSKHPGNARLCHMVDEILPEYAAASRTKKTSMIKDLYKQLQGTTRFVDVDKFTNTCYIVSDEAAKNKIGHTIRYRLNRAARKERRTRQRASGNVSGSSSGSAPSDTGELLFTDQELNTVLGRPGSLPIPDLSMYIFLDNIKN